MLKRILSFFLSLNLLIQLCVPVFYLPTYAEEPLTESEKIIVTNIVEEVKDTQGIKSEKMVHLIEKIDDISLDYKIKLSQKSQQYIRDNVKKIKENLDKIQQAKLTLIDRAFGSILFRSRFITK